MFTFEAFWKANPTERGALIVEQASREIYPDGQSPQLRESLTRSKAINRIINPFIEKQIVLDCTPPENSNLMEGNFIQLLDNILDVFKPTAIEEISRLRPTREELQKSRKNLYELAGATQLAFANKVSRTISTKMGALWEKIADISPYVVNPETEFGTKIAGVDIILKNINSGGIEYAQLKTQKNTLTGSQSGRTDAELGLHENPVFCACFDTSSGWTYKSKKNIPRICGAEFWQRIGIDYDILLDGLELLFSDLEASFVGMLDKN